MLGVPADQDAIVIGGGFYGSAIAAYLAVERGLDRVTLIEAEHDLLTRASANNQARIHNGYHYPRSFTTARRSRVNLPRFVKDWPEAVYRDFTAIYAIARSNSRVSASQFERFCREIGAPVRAAQASVRRLFEPRLISDVYEVEEYLFDARRLQQAVRQNLQGCGTRVLLKTRAVSVLRQNSGALEVVLIGPDGAPGRISSRLVFNCTYSGLNQLAGDFQGTSTRLKHEITEMVLVQAPPGLVELGITVMDGPFFSLMPFPSRELHSLSHVRYTPQGSWRDERDVNPYERLSAHHGLSRADRMIRDVARYLPSISGARIVDAIHEVKTVLCKNENDDGRPILFEKHAALPGAYSILGGKIDNIYDVLEKLDSEAI